MIDGPGTREPFQNRLHCIIRIGCTSVFTLHLQIWVAQKVICPTCEIMLPPQRTSVGQVSDARAVICPLIRRVNLLTPRLLKPAGLYIDRLTTVNIACVTTKPTGRCPISCRNTSASGSATTTISCEAKTLGPNLIQQLHMHLVIESSSSKTQYSLLEIRKRSLLSTLPGHNYRIFLSRGEGARASSA